MIDIAQPTLFDYSALDADTRLFVQEKAHSIHARLKRTAEDVIAIGQDLIEVKEKLDHGQFIPWLQVEFEMGERTARNFMQVAERFAIKSAKFADLPISVLYELAAPSTPETIIEMVEAGTIPPTIAAIREAKREFHEESFISRYDHSKPAYCKYCYETHKDWEISGDHEGTVWICQKCSHVTRDDFMQIEDVEPSQEPLSLADVFDPVRQALPTNWGLVDEKPFTMPFPDGKPVEIPASWKLPPDMRRGVPVIERDDEQARRDIRREQLKERLEQLREKGVELPQGRYSCLVVDPPWQMQKIERDERPNQFEFEYPTMDEDALKAFPLPDVAGDDCHLYLWTTQKHLPLALRLAEHWGFKYQCLMTWVKNVGFTPFSWMYSTEHVLFCRKGNLPLLEMGRRLDFKANVREHSRKPDEFYDLVREVSPGPRLDVFSREKRDGFEQYGNEVEKYVSTR